MAKQFIIIIKCFIILVASFSLHSCKKEHLQPAAPHGSPEPIVYIKAKLDNNSVYFAGGVNNYVGIPSVSDTGNYRTFNFTLQNPQLSSQSYFKISINNYQNILGNPQSDLDSSVYPGSRVYDPGSLFFLPLSVSVYWTDASGIQFRSATTAPNNFAITSTEDIVFESKNYKKATLEFECYLSYNNSLIHLTNGEATVLFSVD